MTGPYGFQVHSNLTFLPKSSLLDFALRRFFVVETLFGRDKTPKRIKLHCIYPNQGRLTNILQFNG